MGKGGGCGVSKAVRVPSNSAQPVVQEEDDEAFRHLYVSWTAEDEQGGPERPITAPAGAVAPFSTTGAVQLSYLLEFVAKRLPRGDPNMPTWSVALNLVQTATAETNLPYTSLPEMTSHVLPYGSTTPYYFVSHAWSRPLREATDMLAHHFRGRDPRDVYVWLDVFAVRQQSFMAVPQAPDMAALEAALRNSSGVLLCLDEAGVALRRTWCLYEAWVGATTPASAPAAPAAGGQERREGGRGEGQQGAEVAPLEAAEGAAARPGSAAVASGGGGGFGTAPLPPPIGVTALMPRAMLPEERARLFSKIDVRQSRCKYKADRDALLAAAREAAGPGGLDVINVTLRMAFMLRPMVADVHPDLSPGRVVEVPELWDMSPVDGWLALPESSKHFSVMALYGPACSGKTIAAAAVARHLRSLGVPLAAHFCNASDVRTLDPVAVVISLALQLAQVPGIGPRLLQQYGEVPAGLLADLVSYNNTPVALEAAVEALLVQPLQRLEQPETANDGTAAAAAGRAWYDNGDLGAPVSGLDEEEEAGGGDGGDGSRGLGPVGAKSVRQPSDWHGPPKVVVLLLDGLDQADGAVMGGAAPFDNQVLQLIEDHLVKLPSFIRLIVTSRSLSYIVPRLTDRLSPLELAPEALRPIGPFMRNVRLAIASIDPALSRHHRASAAAKLVKRSRGSLLYIKMALCCLELERDVAVAEAEANLMVAAVASFNGREGGGGAGDVMASEDVRRTLSRLASAKKSSSYQLPSTLDGLLERYLIVRLRLLNSTELRNKAAAVLAVLAAAREPLTVMQIAATVGGSGGGWSGSTASGGAGVTAATATVGSTSAAAAAPPSSLLAPPPVATARLLPDLVVRGLGALVRLRGAPGHVAQEVLLVHSMVSEWLQQPKPRVLFGGSVTIDLAAGHRALASYCRDDALGCLHRGRLPPYGYSVRHLFLHVGLAAMEANAAAAAAVAADTGGAGGGGGPISPSSVATTARSSAGPLRSRSGTMSYNSSAAGALAAALAAAAAAADWIATMELLLQRLDLWTSIYTAGSGGSARWVILALASLPICSIPSADPGSTDTPLLMLLAEARRWLLLYHSHLCWFPLAVVSSAATLPEDSALRTRALEFAAGPDPWEYHEPEVTTITVTPAGANHGRGAAVTTTTTTTTTATTAAAAAVEPPQQPSRPEGCGAAATAAMASPVDPLEPEHLLLLSTGDVWSACLQTLRTNQSRVVRVAMQPAGRLVATVHDQQRGIALWDIWGARQLLTFARSCEIGPDPTAAFFTPDGSKLVCAARSVFVWEVATGRLLWELCKTPPRKGNSGPLGALRGGIGGRGAAAAAAITPGLAEVADPDGPVTALALSPGGGCVAAGHANGTIRVWDIFNGKLLASMSVPHRRPVTSLSFSPPRGDELVAAHGEGGDADPKALAPVGREELEDVPTALIKADELPIHVWRIRGNSPKELEVLKGHTKRVNTLAFSTLDGSMATGAADETIRIWWNDPKTHHSDYRQIFILGGAGQGVVHTIQFSPAPPTPPLPLLKPPPPPSPYKNASGGVAAADSTADMPVIDFTAPSAARLATAAFGTNAPPSLRDAGSAAAADGSASTAAGARGSAAGAAAVDNNNSIFRGDEGDDDDASEEIRGDMPVMAYSVGNGIVRLWSPAKKRQVGLLRGLEGPVNSLSFSGDGRLLATADQSDTGSVRIWDVGGASVSRPLDCSPASGAGGLPLRHPVEMIALSPDGSRLAVVCADLSKESIRVIDVFTGRRLAVMGPGGAGGHGSKINAVAWSWDSSRLATGSDDLTVRVWYVDKPTAPPSGDPLAAAAAIVAAEMAARNHAPTPATPPTPLTAPTAPQPASRRTWQSNDNDMSASRHLIRMPSPSPLDTAAAEGGRGGGGVATAATAAAAADGTSATAAPQPDDFGLPVRPGQCQLVLEGHHRKVQCVAWAHNGKKLASGGYDQMIRIWDAVSGEQLNLIYQVSWVSSLAFSPDDARLASGAGGRALFMFNSTTGKNLAAYSGPLPGGGECLAGAGRGGGKEATAGAEEAAVGKAAEKGEEGGSGSGASSATSDSWMVALRFNPDGTMLASRDVHSSVTLWDVSGMRLRPARTLDGTYREALFCPTTGDLQLYDHTAASALVVSAIPAASLPLGRSFGRAVALSHPLLEFRGVAVDTAANHNAVVLLSADNRMFFFVNGAHLAAVRQEASRAERRTSTMTSDKVGGGLGGGWSTTTFGGC